MDAGGVGGNRGTRHNSNRQKQNETRGTRGTLPEKQVILPRTAATREQTMDDPAG